jgi:hypothetical protein
MSPYLRCRPNIERLRAPTVKPLIGISCMMRSGLGVARGFDMILSDHGPARQCHARGSSLPDSFRLAPGRGSSLSNPSMRSIGKSVARLLRPRRSDTQESDGPPT